MNHPSRPGRPTPAPSRRASGSVLVAAGIMLSRLSGLVRESAMSRVLGLSNAANAFAAAVKIPNLLQNLLGEGVLSASFVPVYSQLLEEDDDEEAGRVAGAVAGMLMLVVGIAVLVLVLAARPLTRVFALGLPDETFELTVTLVRIMAVGIGFLVLSAWCLGVLNSHRRFFLSYAAPVVWNAVQVVVLIAVWVLDWDVDDAATALAWGLTAGGAAQLLVQLPATRRLAKSVRLGLGRKNPHVRDVRRRFGPVVLGRGVIQLSAYFDLFLASFLAGGAVAALFKAQLLYTLPVSLFAMSVAAAELPELSRLTADPEALSQRTTAALRRIAFWMLLAMLLYVAVGDLIIAVLFEGGRFDATDTVLVWLIVAAYGLGLPAIGISRMLQNACYATGDTAGPARIAAVRVAVSAGIGLLAMFPFDRVIIGPDGFIGLDEIFRPAGPLAEAIRDLDDPVRMGAVGLAIGSAVAAWVELTLLTALLVRKLPSLEHPLTTLRRPAMAAALAFLAAATVKLVVDDLPSLIAAPAAVGTAILTSTPWSHTAPVSRSPSSFCGPARRLIWR